MKALRTPEERFEGLEDYPFAANYFETEDGLRMHYVAEGPSDGPVVLLLHGEPSWSYLYRFMIPPLANAGFRVVVPDLIGFGKSDKPSEQSDYSYHAHLLWLRSLLDHLKLQDILLFCQDWGGLLGLRLVAEDPDRFSMVLASNTALPAGNVEMPKAFMDWREFSRKSPKFEISKVIEMGTLNPLSSEVINAYNAPFPDDSFKAGARIFPSLVPITEDDPESKNNQAAWASLMQWTKPFLTVFGTDDPITKGVDKFFQNLIPGAKGQKHAVITGGHFIQEEKGPELAEAIIDFYRVNQS